MRCSSSCQSLSASSSVKTVQNVCVIGEVDPFVARLLQRFAEVSNLETVRAWTGQEVLQLAHKIRPKAIVLEIELPGQIRGWEAVNRLKSDPATHDIPVIICSWLSEAETQALAGSIDGYLRKPELHYDDFLLALKQAGIDRC